MKQFFLRWALQVLALIAAGAVAHLIMGGFSVRADSVGSILQLFIGVAVLSVLNNTIGALLKILTIPLNCMTLGLFSLVINAIMFMAAASLNLGFSVSGFLPALVGSLLYSVISALLNNFVGDKGTD